MLSTTALLFKKTRRDIAKNYKQFLAVIFIAALAVCLFTGTVSNAAVLKDRVDRLYKAGNIADLWAYVTEFDEADLPALKALDGIAAVEKRLALTGLYNGRTAGAIVTDAQNNSISSYAELLSGDTDFMLERSFAQRNKLSPGDPLPFELPVPRALKTAAADLAPFVLPGASNVLEGAYLNLAFTVTGVMTHPECVDNGNLAVSFFSVNSDVFNAALLSLFAQNYSAPPDSTVYGRFLDALNPNQYVIKTAKGASVSAAEERVRAYFSAKPANNLLSCYGVSNIASNAGIMSDITQAKQLTLVFPVIFFLVAALVILTTISQIILRERAQIGAMKALGVSNRAIFLHYVTLTVALVTIGFILGAATGPLLIPNVMNQKYKLLFSLPSMRYIFPFAQIALCFLLFVLAAAVISYLICRGEILKPPAESMRPAGPKAYKGFAAKAEEKERQNEPNGAENGAKKIGRQKSRGSKKIRRMPLKMAWRNIWVTKPRAAMVIAGITGCTALLVCGFGIDDTLNYGVFNDTELLYPRDITVTFSAAGTEPASLEGVEGVALYEIFASLPASVYGGKTVQTALKIVSGDSKVLTLKWDKTTLAVSSKTAKDAALKEGDFVTFTVAGERYSGEVGVIFDAFYDHGIVAAREAYPALAAAATGAWINVESGADTAAVKRLIEGQSGVASAISLSELKGYIGDTMSGISLMTLTLKVFAVGLAIIVLYNIALLNYRERFRDIATLKVLGLNKREIAMSLIVEIMLLTLAGAIAGMFLGFPLTVLTLSINETPLIYFIYRIKPVSYVFAALITLCASLTVNAALAGFADNVGMAESLKSYE